MMTEVWLILAGAFFIAGCALAIGSIIIQVRDMDIHKE